MAREAIGPWAGLSPVTARPETTISSEVGMQASSQERIREVWSRTLFGRFTPDQQQSILDQSGMASFAPGASVYRGEHLTRAVAVSLVVDGELKLAVGSPDGRMLAIRLCGPGEVLGLRALALQLSQADLDDREDGPFGYRAVTTSALSEVTLLRVPIALIRRYAMTDPRVGCEIAAAVAEQAMRDQAVLARSALASVRIRVVSYLIETARPVHGDLAVLTSHQEIAGSIGTVREVVSRELPKLQDDGVVSPVRGGVRICDLTAVGRILGGDLLPLP